MKKKIVLSFAALLLLVGVTGCDKKSSVKTNGKCNVFECMDLVNIGDSVEDVNATIGLDGELLNGTENTYVWHLSEDTSLEVLLSSDSKVNRVDISFPDDTIKSKKVDFSKFDEIKKALSSKESITLDEFNKKVNGEGTLITKSSYSTSYRWINSDGGYLTASFNTSSGKCTIATGRF